ncbi:MAG TPA: hypothetical protein VJL37_09590 [Flavobacterium sp.]|nr:hypothetical protein [Flavobacterium sp.]
MRSIITYSLLLIFLFTTTKCKPNSLDEKYSTNANVEVSPNETTKAEDKIKGYFNEDNLEDYIVKDKKTDKIILIVYINNGKDYVRKVSFEVVNDDFGSVEEPLQNLFISNPKKGEILVGASCCGSLKTTESNYYKYYKEVDTWILYKVATATVDSDFIPLIDISYQDFAYSIDGKRRDNKLIREKELKELKEKNDSQLNKLLEKFKVANDSKSIDKMSGKQNFDDLAEMIKNIPLSKENISKYNDFAYYLGLCKDGETASVFLLKEIIKKEPSRIVAYLNLADAQWDMEQYENAKDSYRKYDSLMRKNEKNISKIPSRVKERIK